MLLGWNGRTHTLSREVGCQVLRQWTRALVCCIWSLGLRSVRSLTYKAWKEMPRELSRLSSESLAAVADL